MRSARRAGNEKRGRDCTTRGRPTGKTQERCFAGGWFGNFAPNASRHHFVHPSIEQPYGRWTFPLATTPGVTEMAHSLLASCCQPAALHCLQLHPLVGCVLVMCYTCYIHVSPPPSLSQAASCEGPLPHAAPPATALPWPRHQTRGRRDCGTPPAPCGSLESSRNQGKT